jgi:Tol biopolymer transport system component
MNRYPVFFVLGMGLLALLSAVSIGGAAPAAGSTLSQHQPPTPTPDVALNLTRPLFLAALGADATNWSIMMVDPSTGLTVQQLTDDTYDDISPAASADGRYVVFLRGDLSSDAPMDWYLLDLACWPDCAPRPLPAESQGVRDWRWSPVGPQLTGWGPNNGVWIFDVEQDTLTELISGHWYAFPSWSPDGSMIVMTSDEVPPDGMISDDVQVMPAGGGELVNLTYSGEFLEEKRAAYSPDGRWIAYSTINYGLSDVPDPFDQSDYALLMLDAGCIDGAPQACLDSRRPLSLKDQNVVAFAWSPDSRYIAYLLGNPLDTQLVGAIWVIEVETRRAWQLTEDPIDGYLTWSPDSAAILFQRSTPDGIRVYIMPMDGSREPVLVADGFRSSAHPYWAPHH